MHPRRDAHTCTRHPLRDVGMLKVIHITQAADVIISRQWLHPPVHYTLTPIGECYKLRRKMPVIVSRHASFMNCEPFQLTLPWEWFHGKKTKCFQGTFGHCASAAFIRDSYRDAAFCWRVKNAPREGSRRGVYMLRINFPHAAQQRGKTWLRNGRRGPRSRNRSRGTIYLRMRISTNSRRNDKQCTCVIILRRTMFPPIEETFRT